MRAFALIAVIFAAPPACAAAGPAFPLPQRPVAAIVSPTWGDSARRDAAREAEQIAGRLKLRPGMTVADIGAGSGYDSLRLARIVGPGGAVIAEDVTSRYLQTLRASADARRIGNIRIVVGSTGDPKLAPASIDAAIMVHMYHEIERPYELLYNLAPAFRRGGLLGIEEADRATEVHGTPPALLTCELAAVGYRQLSLAPMAGGMGYFAVFAPPAPGRRPAPERIRACRGEPQLDRRTVTVLERPGRRRSSPGWPGSRLIRTGMRWTILVKLPVPGSNGSSENCEPEPGAKLSTSPFSGRPGRASTSIVAGWPTSIRSTWVSLKFAVT